MATVRYLGPPTPAPWARGRAPWQPGPVKTNIGPMYGHTGYIGEQRRILPGLPQQGLAFSHHGLFSSRDALVRGGPHVPVTTPHASPSPATLDHRTIRGG